MLGGRGGADDSPLRKLDLKKDPSIAGRWRVRALTLLNAQTLDRALVDETLNVVLKYEGDLERAGRSSARSDAQRLAAASRRPRAGFAGPFGAASDRQTSAAAVATGLRADDRAPDRCPWRMLLGDGDFRSARKDA